MVLVRDREAGYRALLAAIMAVPEAEAVYDDGQPKGPHRTCKRGHPATPENVYRNKDGRIGYCKVCVREKRLTRR